MKTMCIRSTDDKLIGAIKVSLISQILTVICFLRKDDAQTDDVVCQFLKTHCQPACFGNVNNTTVQFLTVN